MSCVVTVSLFVGVLHHFVVLSPKVVFTCLCSWIVSHFFFTFFVSLQSFTISVGVLCLFDVVLDQFVVISFSDFLQVSDTLRSKLPFITTHTLYKYKYTKC